MNPLVQPFFKFIFIIVCFFCFFLQFLAGGAYIIYIYICKVKIVKDGAVLHSCFFSFVLELQGCVPCHPSSSCIFSSIFFINTCTIFKNLLQINFKIDLNIVLVQFCPLFLVQFWRQGLEGNDTKLWNEEVVQDGRPPTITFQHSATPWGFVHVYKVQEVTMCQFPQNIRADVDFYDYYYLLAT